MNSITLLQEETFSQQMDDIVVPFLEKHKTARYVASCKGGELSCQTFVPDGEFHSVMVIFYGFCEFSEKYDEFTYLALQQGFSVCRFDHRGHGFSPRNDIIKENYSVVDIDSYDTYVTDAKTVVEEIAKPLAGKKPLFLFSHSMGGAIATLYVSKFTDDFTSVILDSPMLQISITKKPFWIVKPFVFFIQFIFGKGNLIPSHKEFPFDHEFDEKTAFTTSSERYMYYYNKRKTDKYWHNWGASTRWCYATLKALQQCNKKSVLEKITVPVLLFQAENDTVVCPGGQDNFVKHVKNAQKSVVKNADHELFVGKTIYAHAWYEKVYSFYEKYVSKGQE